MDSSYLLYAAKHYGANVKAYYGSSVFQPAFELKDAQEIAEIIGAEITVIEMDVLSNEQVVANPVNRCYYCKVAIFGTLCARAKADGIPLVIDGTNASDDASDRPGMKALLELSVRSPLRECNITKDDVRRLSKEAGLPTWNKPAYACLATRVPPDMPITKELLRRVEKSEEALFALGFSDFRVRVMEAANALQAKLQFPHEQMNTLLEKRHEVVKQIKPYFPSILLDLQGRHEV